MSEITNPSLESGPAGASEPAKASIDNPVLDESGAGGAAAAALQNPPLDGGGSPGADGVTDNPPLSALPNGAGDIGLNPPVDEADIEQWFEQQLDQGAIAAPPAKKTAAKRASSPKSGTKSAAKKRSTAAKPAKKQAARRRTASKGSRAQ